ncbi:hypothetical protein PMAYCL1PPCAC_31541, partial [Pristionchus mayeri]
KIEEKKKAIKEREEEEKEVEKEEEKAKNDLKKVRKLVDKKKHELEETEKLVMSSDELVEHEEMIATRNEQYIERTETRLITQKRLQESVEVDAARFGLEALEKRRENRRLRRVMGGMRTAIEEEMKRGRDQEYLERLLDMTEEDYDVRNELEGM